MYNPFTDRGNRYVVFSGENGANIMLRSTFRGRLFLLTPFLPHHKLFESFLSTYITQILYVNRFLCQYSHKRTRNYICTEVHGV